MQHNIAEYTTFFITSIGKHIAYFRAGFASGLGEGKQIHRAVAGAILPLTVLVVLVPDCGRGCGVEFAVLTLVLPDGDLDIANPRRELGPAR